MKKLKLLVAALTILINLAYPAIAAAEDIASVAPIAPIAEVATPLAPNTTIAPIASIAPLASTDPAVTAASDPTPSTTSQDPAPKPHRDSTVTNSGNGADSTNNSTATSTDTTNVNTQNNATVNNDVVVDVTSGDNSASKNMGDASISTGNTSAGAALMTDINNNSITIGDLCGLGCSEGFVAENLKNGSGTLNNANGDLTRIVYLNNANNLSLNNNANLSSTTGGNTSSKNMGSGTIVSGDADVSFTTLNLGNNTYINPDVVTFNILDNRSEDLWINFPAGMGAGTGAGLGAANIGNGADSTSNASANSTSSFTLDDQNNLVLNNNVYLNANTGDNTSDKNMGSGDITTGNANIVSNIVNFLNNTIAAGAKFLIGSVNIFGDMSGNIILPREADLAGCGCLADITAANSGNGAGSTNTSNADATNATDINQTNNANIATNLNLDANTGGNQTNSNMGNSTITTGDTNVNSSLVTVANTNTVGGGDTWWLVIVNNQGTYTGHIVGAADGATVAGSEFGFNPDGTIYALNSGNGADSTNNASSNSNNTTTLNQTNNATINNNINIDANTGNNTADKNMGGANIKTGDVNVASNIVNFVNNNFIGHKFVLLFVNIFGKFTGSIVPPDQAIPTGIGGPVDNNGVASGVNLPSSTTLSSGSKITKSGSVKSSSTTSLSGVTTSLGEALANSGKILNQAASDHINNSITKVVGGTAAGKSGLSFNFVLLGLAFLVIATYAFVARRRAFKK